jgi:hypothetical protein
MKWVLIKKLADIFGYTENAARSKIKSGVWQKGVHWTKAPDNRILFNVIAIQQWIESTE